VGADYGKHDTRREATPALLHCLLNPVRRQILRVLNEPGVALSVGEMCADAIDHNLPGSSFHARVLAERNVIRCTATREAKMGTVHIFASNVLGNGIVSSILRDTEEEDAFLRMK
jgi:hypothetical protein